MLHKGFYSPLSGVICLTLGTLCMPALVRQQDGKSLLREATGHAWEADARLD